MADRTLPRGWRWVSFGEVVREVKEATRDPSSKGLTRIVGLEHLDSRSLPLKRWNDLDDMRDGTSFTRIFRAGQVLFGKRRAYQRKVAIPDFDGICSGDILVFEPSSDDLLSALLPEIVQSDGFFDHALGTSAGSLSPRTKWQELAKYEFGLPPLETQHWIVTLLQAANDHIHVTEQASARLDVLRSSTAECRLFGANESESIELFEHLESIELPDGWRFARADEVCAAPVTSGITPKGGEVDASSDCPFIKVGNLRFDGSLAFSNEDSHLNHKAFEATRSLHVRPGDVLTNIVGPPLGKVSVVPADLEAALINQAIVRFRPPDEMWQTWLCHYLMTHRVKTWLHSRSKKTSGQRNINATTCASLKVPVAPLDEMRSIVAELDEIGRTNEALEMTQKSSIQLLGSLRSHLLAGNADV